MKLMDRRQQSGRSGNSLAFCGLAISLIGGTLIAAPLPAVELSAPVAALYSTVSIFPPSANSMTVCYGFVCRRREILDFTPADRNALSQILAAGRASAAAERAAVQKAVVWFDRRMEPVIGTNKRVAKADFRYIDDKHNLLGRQAQFTWTTSTILTAGIPPATPPVCCWFCSNGAC